MSDYHRCAICKEYGFFGASTFLSHSCKPRFECRLETQDADDWRDTYATDHEAAAEKYAGQYDCNDGCYPIVSGGFRDDVFVLVRKDEDSQVERFCIEAEMVPSYRARKVELTSGIRS